LVFHQEIRGEGVVWIDLMLHMNATPLLSFRGCQAELGITICSNHNGLNMDCRVSKAASQ
jgi:hypothetical protein